MPSKLQTSSFKMYQPLPPSKLSCSNHLNYYAIIDKPDKNYDWRIKVETIFKLKTEQECSGFIRPKPVVTIDEKLKIQEKHEKRATATLGSVSLRRKSIWSKKREKNERIVTFQTRRLSVAQLTMPGRKSINGE